jgi:hypothetical protein
MEMMGVYRIELEDGAAEDRFVSHMKETVFQTVGALQLTRVTSGFDHELLKVDASPRQYAWFAKAHLVGDHKYDFHQWKAVQEHVKDYGKLVAIESYTLAA